MNTFKIVYELRMSKYMNFHNCNYNMVLIYIYMQVKAKIEEFLSLKLCLSDHKILGS